MTGPQQLVPRQITAAPRATRLWRDRAAQVVRTDSPPTVALGTRTGGDELVSQRQARSVIDLALRVGEAMLSTGASAADVVATVLRLFHAYGVTSSHVDITFTSISISIHRGMDEDPLSVMRVIPGRSLDYTRLEAVLRLVDEVVEAAEGGMGSLDVEAARERLADLVTAPHPYRRWIVTFGSALMGMGIVMLFGAGPGMWALAALSALVVDRVQRLLYRAGVAAFFAQVVSAAVPAVVALGLFRAQQQGWDVPGVERPSLVVISGIVILLAGLGLMGATQDALDGYYVTAGARGLEVVLMTLGIGVGVALVMGVAKWMGVSMEVNEATVLGGSLMLNLIGALLIAIGFCLTTYAGLRTTVLAALIGGLGWVIFEGGLQLGLGSPASAAAAAVPVGALAHAAYSRLRVPEQAVAAASIVALLPGLAVYRAINLILDNNPALVGMAVLQFVTAVSIGLGLAAGLSIGGFVARRKFGLDLSSQRARRRAQGSAL